MPAQINISLSEPERVELEKVISSQMTPVRLVERAKAILMAADNIPSYKIAEYFDVDNNTIGRWRRRYAEHRMAGIVKDRPRGANTEVVCVDKISRQDSGIKWTEPGSRWH
ncbi:MAG: helix-turn-helix domain-containing protein [Gammaproteobacteria bacterium]|nr:helix-turn-helix domain-containing protein [Gammaproteobacteria bacterium]MCF6362742.1 helix-turn-helix domain-containing protein [Gammaproteobacteria bacterium]